MKNLPIISVIFLLLSCTYNNQASSSNEEDSTLYQVNEDDAVIYNMITHKNETIKVATELDDGTIKITETGDTLYWLGGDTFGEGEYISKEKWQAYCKEMEELHKECK
jgi:hypothetical protein